MTASRDPERMIHAFLLEGAEQMQDQVFDAIRAEVDLRPQRAVIGPWRVPTLNKLLPIGLGAAAVIAALFLGTRLLGSPSGPGASPEPTATAAPTVTAEPTATPAHLTPSPPSAPPLTETFTSQMHGLSVSYPEEWTVQAATETWTGRDGFGLTPLEPFADVLSDPLTDNLFLLFSSQPIGGSTPDEWVAETMGTEYCSDTEPIAVDGATGLVGAGASPCATTVAVTTAGRGYWIRLFTPNSLEGVPFPPYDRAWFEEVLATVQLHPEDAAN